MKVLVAVALIACVAVQMSHGAPASDDDVKKVDAAPVAAAVSTPVESSPTVVADVKAAAPAADAAAPVAAAPASSPAAPAAAAAAPAAPAAPAAVDTHTTAVEDKKHSV